MADENVIPINALFDESGVKQNTSVNPAPHAPLVTADLIFGRDVMSQRRYLVYGAEALEQIVRTGVTERLGIVVVDIDDDDSDDLERLLALVTVLRGKHDYRGEWDDEHTHN